MRLARLLLDLEAPLVLGLAGAAMLFPALLPAAFLAELLYWPLRRWAAGRWTARTPLDLAVLLLLLTLPLTSWATALPEITRPQVLRLLGGVAVYYALANWLERPARLGWALPAGLLAGLGLALLAPFSVQWPAGKLPFIPEALYQRFSALAGDSIHPNVMAGDLILLLPLALGVLLFAWRATPLLGKLGGLLALAGMAAVVILTQSRGAWLGLAAALLLLVALRWRRGWLALPLAAAGAALGGSLVGWPRLLDLLATSGAVNGLDGRLEIWSRAVYMIQDFPFTGVGMGSFTRVADALYPFFLAAPGSIHHAHNLFLQVAVDLGLPGLIAWLAVLGGLALASWKVYRGGQAAGLAWSAGLGAGLLASLLALSVHGMTDAVTWGQVRSAPLVWAIWGLAAAACNLTPPAPAPAPAKPGS